MGTTIRFFKTEDIEVIAAALTEIGWPDRTSILERYLAEQNAGDRTILVAHSDGNFAGYAATLWKSSYPHFVEQGIPEINDLNVPSRLPATGDIKRPDGRSRETHIREVTSGRYWRGDVSELRLRAAYVHSERLRSRHARIVL